jgi:hypothetical protein
MQNKIIGDEKEQGDDDDDLLSSNDPTLESEIEPKMNLEDMVDVSETSNHINNT